MNKQEYEYLYLAGWRAFQSGKKREACPHFGMGSDGDLKRERWRQGFDDAYAERRK